jgi:hypothetical protein
VSRNQPALLGLLGIAHLACVGAPTPHTPAIDRAEVVKSAAFDHGCPERDIRVLETSESFSGPPQFLLDVCGTRRTYKRVGMMYFASN